MIAYLLRRLGISIVVVIGVTIIVFGLLHVIAPSPGRASLGLRASDAAVAAFNKAHGYDKPVYVQYWNYVVGVLHGHLGTSVTKQSVTSLLGEYAGRSALLTFVSLLFAVGIAIPLGIFQAMRRNTIGDYALTTIAFVTYSMPSFLLGVLLIDVFALTLDWLPAEAAQAQSVGGVIAEWPSMILPVATLTAINVASFSRYMRSAALDVLAQDYIMVAKAKGLSQRAVLMSHLVRNACLPIVTLVGLSLPALLAGNLITEYVFNYDGLGLLFYNSLLKEDYPVLLSYTLIAGVLTVTGNLIADIALSVSDPRIRLA